MWNRGRDVRDYKEAGSVAHFKGTRFAIENQAILGGESYLSPEKARVDTNTFGAWGLNLFIAHAFDYHPQKITYYPSWFYQQPWWKYFHYYADYVRRISYMNAEGRHVAPVALVNPTESAWAGMSVVFDQKDRKDGRPWGNEVDVIDADYADLHRQLAAHQIDFDVMDSPFLAQAKIQDHQLALGNEAFRALVLPPTTTIPRATMKKIEDFYNAGGIVFALRLLPVNSSDKGKDDHEITQAVRRVFGPCEHAGEYASNSNGQGGKAYLVRNSVALLIRLLGQNISRDVDILEGPDDHFYFLHRQKLGQDFYWAVNDSEESRSIAVRFSVRGIPERWDALTGERRPLFYQNGMDGTRVRLSFGQWDAFYVVFNPAEIAGNEASLTHSDFSDHAVISTDPTGITVEGSGPLSGRDYRVELQNGQRTYRGELHLEGDLPAPLTLGGPWQFRAEAPYVPVFCALTKFDPSVKGESQGWQSPDYTPSDWEEQWLSPENFTVRRWAIIGPFPNVWGQGFEQAYAPEKEQDLSAVYRVTGLEQGVSSWEYSIYGPTEAQLKWQFYESPEYYVQLDKIITAQFRHEASGWDPSAGPVAYALTYLYSPDERPAKIRVTAKNVKVLVNGSEVISRYTDLYYIDFRDYWGVQGECSLRKGWNTVLLKIAGQMKFTFRLTKPDGSPMWDLIDSPTRSLPSSGESRAEHPGFRWYRLDVPPGTLGMTTLALPEGSAVFLNGQRVETRSEAWKFTNLRDERNVIAIELPGDRRLTNPFQFESGTRPFVPCTGPAEGVPDPRRASDARPRAPGYRDSPQAPGGFGERVLEGEERPCDGPTVRQRAKSHGRAFLGSWLRCFHGRV